MNINKKKGNALIEFTLVLPILIVLVFGIVEFSILFYDKIIITNASREGARYGVVKRNPSYATNAQITTHTQSYFEDKLISFDDDPIAVTVTPTPSATPQSPGDTLKVKIEFVYTTLAILRLLGLGEEITLSAETIMTYE